MATKYFPTSLPNPSVSYSFEVSSDKIRTKERTARYNNRQRSDVRIYTVSVDWQFIDSQMEIFRLWFRDDLSEGSEIFDIDLFFGDGVKTNEAKFIKGSYNYSYSENLNWNVSAALEVWDADVVDVLSDYYTTMMAQLSALQLPLSMANLETFKLLTVGAEKLDFSTATLETGSS